MTRLNESKRKKLKEKASEAGGLQNIEPSFGDLPNPFVTEIKYAFQDANRLYFVFDYFAGGELFFHLKEKRRLKEDVAKFVTAQVALGIAYLHKFNCLWRSCKPEDVLVGADGYIAITDFGKASFIFCFLFYFYLYFAKMK